MGHLGKLLFNAAALTLDSLPVGGRRFIAESGALIDFACSPRKRRNVRRNLLGTGVEPDRAAILSIFKHHAANMLEIFTASRWDEQEVSSRVQGAGIGLIERALSDGRGAILVTVHVGNWELAARFLGHAGFTMHVVAGVQMNRILTNAVKSAKERWGIEVINPQNSYRQLFRALSKNGVVALLLDGDIFTGGSPVELFGRKVSMPRGAVQLSRRAGAPVIGGFCRRLASERYDIYLESILQPDRDGALDEEEAMKRLYSRIEEYISRNRDQWCMFRDFWGDMR